MNNAIKAKGRRVWHCPPHFTKVGVAWNSMPTSINHSELDDPEICSTIRNWLHTHIQNRFYLGSVTEIDGQVIIHRDVVAFEEASDATFFALMRTSLYK